MTPCVSLGVSVGYFYCLCFCWQLHFIILRLNKDQVDSETREHCRIGFLCRHLPRKLSGLKLVFADVTDTFLILLLCTYSSSSSAIQSSSWTSMPIYIKEKSLKWFNFVSFKCTWKGYYDMLKFSVFFSFIRCWLCSQQNVSAFCPKATQTWCTAAS